jgi:dihydroneopterin aldolase
VSRTSRVMLTGIPAEGRHGADPGEQVEPQAFVIDLDVTLEVGEDTIDDTIDYRIMADTVRRTVAGPSFVLLESLAEEVARAVYAYPRVLTVTATVHKPGAAGLMGVEDVAAEATFE